MPKLGFLPFLIFNSNDYYILYLLFLVLKLQTRNLNNLEIKIVNFKN